jgi:hypothetical protein
MHRRPELPRYSNSIQGARLIALLFVAMISVPLGANLAGIDGADPAAENRELARFPRLEASWPSIAVFGPGLGAWFDDHFGLRSALVRWYGESRLFWLGGSPTSSVVKGADGWFFYGDDWSIEDYANVDPLTPAALANWREAIMRARRWLDARHVAYVFMIAPDKHAIYGEKMPETIAKVGERSRADQLFTALQDLGIAVDVRSSLDAAKSRERIYQQTDTHWNDRGALVAYQRIIGALRARVPRTPVAWTRDAFDPAVRTVPGMDLAGMMGLTRVLTETDLPLIPKRARRARVVEPAGAAPTAEEGRLVTEVDDPALPRAVIFRDSFVSRLVPFLSEHFSRAVYLWQNDFDADVVRQEHPDVVIQEIVGRHLYSFVPSPELVPQ